MHDELKKIMTRRLEIQPLPDEVVYLSENKFRQTWLPMFLSFFSGQEGGLASAWATNVAGNYYRPVHVVKNEDKPGEILFTVPGLFNQNHQVYSEQMVEQIPNIIASAVKHNDVVPGSGDNYLLNNLVDSAAPSQSRNDEEEAWKKIYLYYGIDAPFLHKTKTTAKEEREKVEQTLEGFDDDF